MKKYDKEYSTQYYPEVIYLKENGINYTFVKVVNEEPKSGEVALVIKKGSLSVEINKLMNNSDLISLIKAIGECNSRWLWLL